MIAYNFPLNPIIQYPYFNCIKFLIVPKKTNTPFLKPFRQRLHGLKAA